MNLLTNFVFCKSRNPIFCELYTYSLQLYRPETRVEAMSQSCLGLIQYIVGAQETFIKLREYEHRRSSGKSSRNSVVGKSYF